MAIDTFTGDGPSPDNQIDGSDVELRIERGMRGVAGEAHPCTEYLLAEKDETRELDDAINAMTVGHLLERGLP